jgi:hypothetical protein
MWKDEIEKRMTKKKKKKKKKPPPSLFIKKKKDRFHFSYMNNEGGVFHSKIFSIESIIL